MDSNIKNAVEKARKDFEIEIFPGNLFNFVSNSDDNIDRHKILVIKKHLDKIDGFISYEKEFTYIGVNQFHPIGRQNFTLAHELGHKYMHMGRAFNDNAISQNSTNRDERDASDFASELLYPTECLTKDYNVMINKEMFKKDNSAILGKFINDLCHKYFMSFDAILRKLFLKRTGKFISKSEYSAIKNNIQKALGHKYTQLDVNFHISQNSTYNCENSAVNDYLKELVTKAIKANEISPATGEAILFSNGLLEDDI